MNDRTPNVRAAGPEDLEALVAGNMALAEETERVRRDMDTLRHGIRALLESRVTRVSGYAGLTISNILKDGRTPSVLSLWPGGGE